MSQSIQLHTGTVKFSAGKVFETQYGSRINAVVVLPTGEEIKLWGSPGDAALTALKKGEQVQLLKDQKGFKLVADTPAETPQAPVAPTNSNGNGKRLAQTWSDDERRAIASKVEQHSKLMKYCFDQVKTQFGEGMSEESLRTMAITVYLQNCK